MVRSRDLDGILNQPTSTGTVLVSEGNPAGGGLGPLSLRQNFSWTLVSNVVYAGCQWAMLVVLAKLGSTEMVGQFTLGLAITAPVVLLSNLQLAAVLTTDARRDFSFAHYLGLRLATTAAAFVVIAVIVSFSHLRRETSAVVLIVGLMKCLDSISDIFFGLQQQRERMNRIGLAWIMNGVVSLLAMLAAVVWTKSIVWAALGSAFGSVLTLLCFNLTSGIRILSADRGRDSDWAPRSGGLWLLRPRWDRLRSPGLLRLSLPLGVAMMLVSLNANIPRYFVQHYLGERELGIFSALAYVFTASNMVVCALGQAASPRLARHFSTGDHSAFRRLTLGLIAGAVGLGVVFLLGALLVGSRVLTLLYSSEYAVQLKAFQWLMVAAVVWNVYSVLGYGATAARKIRFQPVAQAVMAAAGTGAAYYLVPLYGLVGASLTLLVCAMVGVGGYAILLILPGRADRAIDVDCLAPTRGGACGNGKA